MKKLITLALTALTLTSITFAQTVVNNFGVAGWKSGDTRQASGTTLRGITRSHGNLGGTYTAADDTLIGDQIKFMGEGQTEPSLTSVQAGVSPTGSLNGLGYVRIDGTSANNGKTSITNFNALGFGTTSSIFASGMTASYRYFTESLSTARTPGFGFFGADSATGSFFNFTYVHDPSNGGFTPNAWNTANITDTSGLWIARLNGVVQNSGVGKTIADWKLDSNAGIYFGAQAGFYEYGFWLGSSQRNAVAYIDYMEMSTLNAGQMYDFQAVPEPATMTILALAAALRRRKAKKTQA